MQKVMSSSQISYECSVTVLIELHVLNRLFGFQDCRYPQQNSSFGYDFLLSKGEISNAQNTNLDYIWLGQ